MGESFPDYAGFPDFEIFGLAHYNR